MYHTAAQAAVGAMGVGGRRHSAVFASLVILLAALLSTTSLLLLSWAYARAEASYEAARLAQGTAEDARRIADIADAAYQGGETGITELIDGYRAGAEARIAAIDLAERAIKARADHILAQEGEER